jgi:hypothetical protein
MVDQTNQERGPRNLAKLMGFTKKLTKVVEEVCIEVEIPTLRKTSGREIVSSAQTQSPSDASATSRKTTTPVRV